MKKHTQIHAVPSRAQEKAGNISGDARQHAEIARVLSHFLASTYVLYQKSLFYHWNVKGPNFVGLHTLFEEHYQELHKAGDVIAERIRALGHASPGTFAEFASMSSVREDSKLPAASRDMVANLLKSHETCSKEAKQVFDCADKAGDEVTGDLMVQRMAFHDKTAWMLRALQE